MSTEDWARDAELLEAWRGGDAGAGRALVERHLDAVARFFRTKVSADLDDLVQQTMLALVEGRDRIRAGTSVRAYLLTTAYRVLRAHTQRLARGRVVDFSVTRMVDLGPGPSTMAGRGEDRGLLLAGLRQLTIEHQVALELAYWEGLNAAEIAAIVGISHSATRSRLSAARRRLAEILAQLATSPAQLRETLDDLEAWAARQREVFLD